MNLTDSMGMTLEAAGLPTTAVEPPVGMRGGGHEGRWA